jgi:hypothetical protein
MDEHNILQAAEKGCMAYEDYDTGNLLEKARECEKAGIDPEYVLVLANKCCGLYEFYNPERLLRKALAVNELGYDPVVILENACKDKERDFQPVRILSEIIDRES